LGLDVKKILTSLLGVVVILTTMPEASLLAQGQAASSTPGISSSYAGQGAPLFFKRILERTQINSLQKQQSLILTRVGKQLRIELSVFQELSLGLPGPDNRPGIL
jgi:hypothetical protein